MKNYEIGIYEKAIPENYAMQDMLEIAKNAGYDFLEISIDRTDKRIERLYDKQFIQKIAIMQQEVGFRIGSMCLSALSTYTLGNSNEIIRDKGRDIFFKAINFSIDVGIRIIQIPACDVPKGEDSSSDSLNYYLNNLQEIIEYASAKGIMIALENMETKQIDSIQKCMKLIKKMKSPYFQLYPDSGNIMTAAYYQGIDPTDDMAYGEGYFAGFHIKETTPERFGGLFYGEGYVDFPKIVRKAWDLGVRRFVMEYWYTGNLEWKKDLKKAYILCQRWIKGTDLE